MKMGSEKITYTYFLGKLEVAKIVYVVDYGVSYDYLKDKPTDPIRIQTLTTGGFLATCNKNPLYTPIKTIQEGISKLRELTGDKFVHLKLTTGEISDVKEI